MNDVVVIAPVARGLLASEYEPVGSSEVMGGQVTMRSCPKYQGCNKPFCPIDERPGDGSILADEGVCFYLLESVKQGARDRFEGVEADIINACQAVREVLLLRYPRLALLLRRAEKYPSRKQRSPVALSA